MTIRADSFSSVAEVVAFTRHLLDGHTTFDTTTRPTLAEIEKFIDRASALLNSCIAKYFAPSAIYGNAVAKLACDDWVTQQAVKYAHYAQRSTAIFSEKPELFVMDDACEFVEGMINGWVNLGIAQADSMSQGLAFTAIDAQAQRADPADTTREQPLFSRRNFDNT